MLRQRFSAVFVDNDALACGDRWVPKYLEMCLYSGMNKVLWQVVPFINGLRRERKLKFIILSWELFETKVLIRKL